MKLNMQLQHLLTPWLSILSLLIILGATAACTAVINPNNREATPFLSPPRSPSDTLIVAVGNSETKEGKLSYKGQLLYLDTNSWQVRSSQPLTPSVVLWLGGLREDPQRRIWVDGGTTGGVQIYDHKGQLLRTLHPCQASFGNIQFAAGRAFITCLEQSNNSNTIVATVVALSTLETLQTITLGPADIFPVPFAGASDDEHVVITSRAANPQSNQFRLRVHIVDAHNLELRQVLTPTVEAAVTQMAPFQGKFYLVNQVVWGLINNQSPDVLVITPTAPPRLELRSLAAPRPMLGDIEGNTLFTYHGQGLDQSSIALKRIFILGKQNLITGDQQMWTLPDTGQVTDLRAIHGKFILGWVETDEANQPTGNAGIYMFNPITQQFRQLVDLSGMTYIVLAR